MKITFPPVIPLWYQAPEHACHGAPPTLTRTESGRRAGGRGGSPALSPVRHRPRRSGCSRVTLGACELTLKSRERVDDLRCLVGAVSPTDRDLAQDARLHETLDGGIGRLERAAKQRRRALGCQHWSSGEPPKQQVGCRVGADRAEARAPSRRET